MTALAMSVGGEAEGTTFQAVLTGTREHLARHYLTHSAMTTAEIAYLRARQEIMPGFGFILPTAEAQRFAAAVPSARVVEIDANHYTVTTHDDSIAAIGAFQRSS